jgi:hypothetical protein
MAKYKAQPCMQGWDLVVGEEREFGKERRTNVGARFGSWQAEPGGCQDWDLVFDCTTPAVRPVSASGFNFHFQSTFGANPRYGHPVNCRALYPHQTESSIHFSLHSFHMAEEESCSIQPQQS